MCLLLVGAGRWVLFASLLHGTRFGAAGLDVNRMIKMIDIGGGIHTHRRLASPS